MFAAAKDSFSAFRRSLREEEEVEGNTIGSSFVSIKSFVELSKAQHIDFLDMASLKISPGSVLIGEVAHKLDRVPIEEGKRGIF